MRKCGECGYLIFSDGDVCNHCGAALELTPVGAPTTVADAPVPAAPPAAPTPAHFAAPSPLPRPVAPPVMTGPPGMAPPPDPSTQLWRPESAPTVGTRRRARALVGLVVAVATSLGVSALLHARDDALPAGTSAFVHGDSVAYSSPDGRFDVKMPAAPDVRSKPFDVGNYHATVTVAVVERNDYELGAADFVMSVTPPSAQIDSALDDALNFGVAGANGTLTSKQHIVRGGLPAVVGHVKAPDGYGAVVFVMAKQNVLYMLIVHAKHGTDKLYNALESSLVVH